MRSLKSLMGVRWLVLKDLQIMRRTPFTLALLVIYPAVLAILIGVALSKTPERPKVAFYNEISKDGSTFILGNERIDTLKYTKQLFTAIDPIIVHSRKGAIDKVRSGRALGALVIPANLPERIETGIMRPELASPQLDIYVNEEDPIKARLVDNAITSQIGRANLALSQAFARIANQYANLLLKGGSFSFLGESFHILGLLPSQRIIEKVVASMPPRSRDRKSLQRVVDFARLGSENFQFSDDAFGAISEPIKIRKHVVSGKTPSLTTYAAALAIAISMMFVTVILGAASLALEREEGAYTRLVRGPISYGGLIVAKVVLAVSCSFVLSFVLLGVLQLFVSLEWQRIAIWPVAILIAAAAFAALGVAIGGLTREVRAASLAAIMLSFPVIFLALVPSGSVSGAVYELVKWISAIFPFKVTVDAMNRALYGAGPGLAGSLLHLLALLVAYLGIARISLRRFVV